MGILLGFAPFIVFALLAGISVSLALWVAFAAAFVITIRDFVQSPTLRLLDAGSIVLFGMLALFTGFIVPSLSIQAVRFIVEVSFLAILLISLLLKRPVTFEYSHDHLPDEVWKTPRFLRANYTLTGVWALGFALMTSADAVATFNGEFPLALDIAAGLAVLGIIIAFTVRYPAAVITRNPH